MKPYLDCGTLPARQTKFTRQFSTAGFVTENAFCHLKGRWQCRLKQNKTDLKNLTQLVAACCTLHNSCEVHGDSFDSSWQVDSDILISSPGTPSTAAVSTSTNGSDIREALATYFVTCWQTDIHVCSRLLQQYHVIITTQHRKLCSSLLNTN